MTERNQGRGRRGSRPATPANRSARPARPPREPEPGPATETTRHFADALRTEFLTRLDLGFGELSRRIAAGISAGDLSRFAAGTKLPTFDNLDAILAFAEKEYGQPLPADAVRELRARHIQAVRECSPAAYDLHMAVEEVRAWRGRYSRSEGVTALATTKWRYAVLAHDQAADQLRRTQSAAEREEAAADRDRALEAAEAERASVQAENVRVSTQLLAVRDNLSAQVGRLEAEVVRLTDELQEAQGQQREAWEQGALLAAQLAAAEQRVLDEQQRGDRLEDEVRLLDEMRRNSLREREVHQAQQEARLREHQVLADAQAAVDAARQLETAAPRALTAAATAPGTGAGAGSTTGSTTGTGKGSGSGGGPGSAEDPATAPPAEHGRTADDALATSVVVGTPAEVAEVVRNLVERSEPDRVREALALAAERPGAEVVALVQALEEAGCYPQKEQLLIEAAGQPAVMVAAAIRALHEVDRAAEIGWLLEAAAKAAPQDVTSLTLELLGRDMRADAGRLLDAAAPRRSAHEVADLVVVLYDAGWTGEAERLVKDASVRRSGREIVELLRTLQVSAAATLAGQVTAAVADRVPSALAATVRALGDAGETKVVETVLGAVAGRPADEVAKVVVALADAGCAELGVRTVRLRVARGDDGPEIGREVGELAPLLTQLVREGRPELLHHVVGGVARQNDVRNLPVLLSAIGELGLGNQAEGARHAATREIALRPWEDVLAAVTELDRTLPEFSPVSSDVIRHFLGAPVLAEVVPFLDRWLDTAPEEVAQALPSLAVAADLPLVHHLELAVGLREVGRRAEAAELLRTVGELQQIAPDAVRETLDLGVHGVGVRQLLDGWANRDADEVTPLVELLLTTGHEAAAWFLLDRFVPRSEAAELASVWTRLAEAGHQHAVERLAELIVETAGHEVMAALVTLPAVGAHTSLLPHIAAHSEPEDLAGQLNALAEAGNWDALRSVLHRTAKGPRGRARAVAAQLAATGRPRQAAWLGEQADRPGSRRDTPAPGGETPQEIVQMALAVSESDPAERLAVVLNGACTLPTRELLTLLGRLRAEPELADLAAPVGSLPHTSVPGLRPRSSDDAADLAEMLRVTLDLTEQARGTLVRALTDLPVIEVGRLMKTCYERALFPELGLLRDWAPRRLAGPELLALVVEVQHFHLDTAAQMARNALRSEAEAQYLRELADFSVRNGFCTIADCVNLLIELRPPEQVAHLVAELRSAGRPWPGSAAAEDGAKAHDAHERRIRAAEALPGNLPTVDDRDPLEEAMRIPRAEGKESRQGAAARELLRAAQEERRIHTEKRELRRQVHRALTNRAQETAEVHRLWSAHLQGHPLLTGDSVLRSWFERCVALDSVQETYQVLHLALLRLPLAEAEQFAAELASLRRQEPGPVWSIPLDSGEVVQLSSPALAEHEGGGHRRPKGPDLDHRLSAAVSDALWLMSTDQTLMGADGSNVLRPLADHTVLFSEDIPTTGLRLSSTFHELARVVAEVGGPAMTAAHVRAYGRLDEALGSLVHAIPASPGSWWGRRRLTLLKILRELTDASGAAVGWLETGVVLRNSMRTLWVISPAIRHPGYRAQGRHIESSPKGPRIGRFG